MRNLRRVVSSSLAALLASAALPAVATPPKHAPVAAPGVDATGMDRSVKPGDDFFGYANGEWVKRTEIPADKSRWGAFSVLAEETDRRTADLLEAAGKAGPLLAREASGLPAGSRELAAGSDERKAGDFYASFMDEATIEAKGISAIKPALDRIAQVKDRKDLARLLGEELRADVDPLNTTNFHTDRLFGLWVSPALHDPTQYVPYLLQGGLDMPDREYYLAPSPRMAETRARYLAHVATTLALAGFPDAGARADRIVALETKMAVTHASRAESLEVHKADNPWKRTDYATRAPGLDWATFFQAAHLDGTPVVVAWHPKAIAGLSKLAASEPLESWKDWLVFHTIDRRAKVLPRAFLDERFEFHGRTLTGAEKIGDRWKLGVAFTNDALGDAVGQLYVKRYFSPEAKATVQALVKNVVAAFGARVDKLDWMSPATKAKAKEKLATLYVGVGYPDKWTDYGKLEVTRGDALGNWDRAERFEYERSLGKLGKPVDKSEWAMTPQVVNAVNLPLQNALNFPAAILQPPFFDPAAPAAVNYGAIGSTIGHEISHSFDDQGAEFDAQGRLASWWTKEDFAHFEASGAQLATQFDGYRPFPDLHVNGRQTLSENIADVAGLSATHDAWLLSLGGKPAPKGAGGLTGEQQFFLAFAQVWRLKAREPALRQQLITDGHAPAQYRAATVRNLDAWYDAFAVKAGQALYLAPKDRVHVW